MKKINLLILDDEIAFTAALVGILSKYADTIKVEDVAHSPQAALESLRVKRANPIDIILLDLEMPKAGGGDGFDFLSQLYTEYHSVKVIMLTTHNAFSLASKAIELGASGFLLKSTAIEKIVPYIQQVYLGNIIIDPTIKHIRTGNEPYHNVQFDEDDYFIVHSILEENTSEVIAQKLKIHNQNKAIINAVYIENRRRKIIEAIGCKNVVGVAKYALQKGLYPLKRGEPHHKKHNHAHKSTPHSQEKPIKVFILDDHEVFAQGMSHLLTNYKKKIFHLTAYARSKEEFSRRIDEMIGELPDILLLDYTLPGENIPLLIEETKERYPSVRIIVILQEYNAHLENILTHAGANGLVHRKMEILEMLEIIIDGALADQDEPATKLHEDDKVFDAFELEIVRRILDEKDSRTIATELYTGELQPLKGDEKLIRLKKLANRIDARRTRILDKIGGINVVSLVKYAWTEYLF